MQMPPSIKIAPLLWAHLPTAFLLIFASSLPTASARSEASSALRLCEIQGTCFKCPDGHFSHFICRADVDCFAGEFCVQQRRFCCPAAGRNDAMRDENRTSALCPDGSNWGKMCKTDGDCLFRDELCAEGKCCPSCRQRRLQALRELRSFVSAAGAHRNAAGGDEFIPQCSDDGKHFRAMQCTGHSGECFCVDKFGRRHSPSKWTRTRGAGRRGRGQREAALNCSSLREQWAQEGEGEGGPRVALNRDRWLTAPEKDAIGGAQEEENGAAATFTTDQHCHDPLREFRHCGSACPISCATRIVPQCPQEQCMRGCFCRLPYVILDATDPFGSRCVLPAECPLLQFTPDLDQWNGGFFPANQPPTTQQQQQRPPSHSMDAAAEKCRDPLKNFQSCGSQCPVGCGGQMAARECPSRHCVPGCFCRIPYVLRDPSDPNSECLLPQQCPQSPPIFPQLPPMVSSAAAASHAQQCLADRNQSWTGCFSRKCSRSCGEWPPFCVPDDCQTGCECTPPAVIRDKSAPIWECILPEDCPPKSTKNGGNSAAKDAAEEKAKCGEGERKEFLQCGSSCPLGCDRLDQPLRHCSPCAAGCFCKNGFVFVNASEWRTSGCVPLNECPQGIKTTTTMVPAPPILMPASATTITAIQRLDAEISPQCSANALDREGQFCQDDAECGDQRKCCSQNATAPARCTCRDPNAIWTQCGPLCPEYCAQSGPHLCPGPCRPGCFCPPGYVKKSRDPGAECVPVAQCAIAGEESLDSEAAIANEGGGGEKVECGEAMAMASLFAKDGERIGRVLVRPERPKGSGVPTRRIRLNGEFAPRHSALSTPASLLISLHQFSDTTINGCAGVGRALRLRIMDEDDLEDENGNELRDELVAIRREDASGTFWLDQRIEWPDPIGQGTNPLIGHSIVLQQINKGEHRRHILGCAVLGIAPSC